MTQVETRVRERLLTKREQLAEAAEQRREQRLVDLLRRVDGALASLEVGDWGVCTVCHEPVNEQRLEADPLVKVCIECLSTEDRQALERDLEAAARVQRSLLPPARFRHDGWEVAFLWEPRGPVSGDHVDL
ncbi:MAG TPA: TraR/DksA C4-type zinc finger protein, partial [Thermoanaerobaculia bacterium]|nr:TraR/DksA C4-type zinc finger protein [Thermoanaerobaculia bacterium]